MRLTDEKINSYFYEPSIAIWESGKFKVYAFKDGQAVRLDIERKDKKDGITWDELQQIKNDCGFANCDAVEFYPAEMDVINTGNLRHLYVFFEKLPLIRRL
jgi:hypothetical protein